MELRGFGAFSVKERDARMGRNPRTGESVFVEAKRLPFFKTGKALRERLNDDGNKDSAPTAESMEDEIASTGDFGGSSNFGTSHNSDDGNNGGGGHF